MTRRCTTVMPSHGPPTDSAPSSLTTDGRFLGRWFSTLCTVFCLILYNKTPQSLSELRGDLSFTYASQDA